MAGREPCGVSASHGPEHARGRDHDATIACGDGGADAAPGFVEKHSEAIIGMGDARFPLRYTDKATGASIEMSDLI